MRSFLICDNFTYIMKKTSKPNDIYISAQLTCKGDTDLRFLQCMRDHILAVRKSVFKSTEKSNFIRRHVVNAYYMTEFFPLTKHNLFYLFLCLMHQFFDSDRLNSSVFNKSFQSDTGNFSSYRIKR